MRRTPFIVMLAAMLLTTSALGQVSEIKKSLICLCECGMTVEACEGAMSCSSAAKMTATVEKMVADGESKQEVLASFVDTYGEEVLAAPTKKGFNLAAWVLPFLATIAAGIGICLGLTRWVRYRETQASRNPRRVARHASTQYESLLDKELESYD